MVQGLAMLRISPRRGGSPWRPGLSPTMGITKVAPAAPSLLPVQKLRGQSRNACTRAGRDRRQALRVTGVRDRRDTGVP
jgi:hypothetical protein